MEVGLSNGWCVGSRHCEVSLVPREEGTVRIVFGPHLLDYEQSRHVFSREVISTRFARARPLDP